jgi:bifunctional non-homologous end joining protein LigD
LHYDFRLEVDGVLASWAVPRGPTLDPKARRSAIHVPDHPVEYIDFEGIIPRGQYGGGDVIVWDRGTWTYAGTDTPASAIARGEIHLDVRGDKLAGRFALVRRGSRDGDDQWLLVHKADEHAVPGWDAEDHPLSVRSGRTNEQIAADPPAMWQSGVPAAYAEVRLTGGGWEPPTPDELDALDGLGRAGRWRIAGRELALTNLDKVLFPARGRLPRLTKRDLIRYYARIGPWMLPYLIGRPVNMHRYPDGIQRGGFWHKQIPTHAPDWLVRWHNPEADPGETECYLVPDGVASLAWLANFAAVELHPWTSRLPEVHQPSWALIDIDPGPRSRFDDVLVLARLYRAALAHLDVDAAPKVTGRRGVQIWIPVAPGYTFDDTRSWVERISRAVGHTAPDLVSWEWYKDRRGGLARLDYTQNAINKTLVSPFSPRPAPGAPVSVPLQWAELDDPALRPDRWTTSTVLERTARCGDPLARLVGRAQHLPAV